MLKRNSMRKFWKKKKHVRETTKKKKSRKTILGEIAGEKNTWEENLRK
jgi:hypothetical protein